jgi:hypothetical protein
MIIITSIFPLSFSTLLFFFTLSISTYGQS